MGAVDDVQVAKVAFLINGAVVQELSSAPWVINAPDGLVGRVTVFGRLMNLTDELYAENAGYTVARGEEYAPGLPINRFCDAENLGVKDSVALRAG